MSDFESLFGDDGSQASDFGAEWSDEETLFLLEDGDEYRDSPGPSTSKRGRKGAKGSGRVSTLVTCHICRRGLKTLEGYKKHLQQHRIAEMFLCAPVHDAVQTHCRTTSKEILSEYISCPLFKGGISQDVIGLAKAMLEMQEESLNCFVDNIMDLIWKCLPRNASNQISTFHKTFNNTVNNEVVCDVSVRDNIEGQLKAMLGVDTKKALKFLVGDFTMKMTRVIEGFYLKCIREGKQEVLYGGKDFDEVSRDSGEDMCVQGSVYYIGGSTVRTVLNRAQRATNSPEWKMITPCLLDRFIAGSLAEAPASEITAWTEGQNRGGLKFISEPAWTFLMALGQVLVKLERPDGSVPHVEVLQTVKDDDVVSALWFDLIGETLSEEAQDFLLQHVCEVFTNSWGRGIMLRRTNIIKGKSRDKVALRPSLLNTKNK